MRPVRFVLLAFAALAAAACREAVAPSSLAPGAPSLAGGPAPQVTICHAAGRAGTTHFITLTVSQNGLGAHFLSNGTPKAGHELDTLGPCTQPSGTLRICVANGSNMTAAFHGGALGAIHLAGDVNPYDENIPDAGNAANCTEQTISTGPLQIDNTQPSDVWLMCVDGATPLAGANVNVYLPKGGTNSVTTSIAVATTTVVTFLHGFDNSAEPGQNYGPGCTELGF